MIGVYLYIFLVCILTLILSFMYFINKNYPTKYDIVKIADGGDTLYTVKKRSIYGGEAKFLSEDAAIKYITFEIEFKNNSTIRTYSIIESKIQKAHS